MYLFSWDLPDPGSNIYDKRMREQSKGYQREIERIHRKLRPHTREFALAEWHYDPSDHRCPHDGWLEAVTISERADPANAAERSLQIQLRLLGAYHNGFIEITYHDVASYTFDVPYRRSSPPNYRHSQGNWQIDEISFSSNGLIIHEIEWDKGGHWIIECSDIEYRWLDSPL